MKRGALTTLAVAAVVAGCGGAGSATHTASPSLTTKATKKRDDPHKNKSHKSRGKKVASRHKVPTLATTTHAQASPTVTQSSSVTPTHAQPAPTLTQAAPVTTTHAAPVTTTHSQPPPTTTHSHTTTTRTTTTTSTLPQGY